MMLVVWVPGGVAVADVEAALAAATVDLDLVVVVRAIEDDIPASPSGEAWTVSVYGADHPGIVHSVATALAAQGANVVDLTTRVIGEASRPVYAMFLDVTLPPGTDGPAFEASLEALAAELGVSCRAHPADADIL